MLFMLLTIQKGGHSLVVKLLYLSNLTTNERPFSLIIDTFNLKYQAIPASNLLTAKT